MMKFTDTTILARDLLISCAIKLPDNLVFDVKTEHGAFTVNFLLRLNSLQDFANLRKEAAKKEGKEFFLFFYSISETDYLNGKAPFEVKDFSTFDFSKVKKVLFNGSTVNYLPKSDADPIPYVSATLVLKD